MLTLTDRAVSVLSSLCAQETASLRISANSNACAGIQYAMSLEDHPGEQDEVLTFGELQVFVDRMSTLWLTGVKVDYVEDESTPGFRFEPPPSATKCSCSGKCG
jgi:iron-sulfur cluster assembly protein